MRRLQGGWVVGKAIPAAFALVCIAYMGRCGGKLTFGAECEDSGVVARKRTQVALGVGMEQDGFV